MSSRPRGAAGSAGERELLSAGDVARTIARMAHQVIEKTAIGGSGPPGVVLLGIPTRGRSVHGFRYDYAEKYKARNLLAFAKHGVRAKAMLPVSPTTTFPNHYSIATGLSQRRWESTACSTTPRKQNSIQSPHALCVLTFSSRSI